MIVDGARHCNIWILSAMELGHTNLVCSCFKKNKKDDPCTTSYKVAKGYPRRYLGSKVVLKNILGTRCGTCEGLGVRGIWKVVGKMALAHQLLGGLEAP